jgi:prevent-host-death family protein
MHMHVVDFAQAEARFAELLGRVQAGEEILVTRADVPVARIMPATSRQNRPRFGAAKDLLHVVGDFDEPLADFAPYTG